MHLWIQCMIIRESRDQLAFDQSPGLIAVFHALHRLLAPRHPPHALSSLAALIVPLPVSRQEADLGYATMLSWHINTIDCVTVNPRYSLDAYRDLSLAHSTF